MRTSKSVGPTAPRPYRMQRRAAQVDDTRQRITEAAMKLHTTVGPSRASIAAIAEKAGVTRLTVYRHFSDAEQIFAACMGHWAALHPAPDIEAWRAIDNLEERARRALTELYAWYAEAGHELLPIRRDWEFVPPGAAARAAAASQERAEAIVGREGDAATSEGRQLRVVATHIARLETWHSLVGEQRLTHEEAVDAGVIWILAVGRGTGRIGSG